MQRIIDEGRTGLSWAGVLDDASIDACVAEARDNARFAGADPNAGLAEPDGVATFAIAVSVGRRSMCCTGALRRAPPP